MVVPTFQSAIAVRPVVFSVGAEPLSVFQVTASEVQVIVRAVPSSIINVIDWPSAQVPAVGVLFAVSVQVWIEPLVGDRAGVVPVTVKTSSVKPSFRTKPLAVLLVMVCVPASVTVVEIGAYVEAAVALVRYGDNADEVMYPLGLVELYGVNPSAVVI